MADLSARVALQWSPHDPRSSRLAVRGASGVGGEGAPVKKPDAREYRDKFRSNCTRVGLNLNLSRAMLEFLCAVSDDAWWDRARYGGYGEMNSSITTSHALKQRGLIRHRGEDRTLKLVLDEKRSFWRLTPIGELLVALLKEAGIFIQAEVAAERFAKRKGRK